MLSRNLAKCIKLQTLLVEDMGAGWYADRFWTVFIDFFLHVIVIPNAMVIVISKGFYSERVFQKYC